MTTSHSLSRSERLRTLGAVRRLFACGQSGFVYPIRYIWYAEVDDVAGCEVLFSVPKKFHKRANKRNLLRRRVKEASRLQKQLLIPSSGKSYTIVLALIHSTKESHSYNPISN